MEKLAFKNNFEVIEKKNYWRIAEMVGQVASRGYAFENDVISEAACAAMEEEVASLDLELGDHVSKPIYAGTPREIRQLHARAYFEDGFDRVPVATLVNDGIVQAVHQHAGEFPKLKHWHPSEIGYQFYRHGSDWISPHRDRRNDQYLGATVTISGNTRLNMFMPTEDPDDYTKLRLIDHFYTDRGGLMLLRAPGFAGGEQIIHEVQPPINPEGRLIVNFRMRPDILKQPSEIL